MRLRADRQFWKAQLLTVLILVAPVAAVAQTSDNVLVVINESSPASIQVGEYYARARRIATDHIVRIKVSPSEAVQRGAYEQEIEAPIGVWLAKNSLQDKVLYLVLTKDVPLRIAGTQGLNGTLASVDSELTLLYRKLLGITPATAGRVDNPLFLGDKTVADAKPVTRFSTDIYMVTRLDGFSVDDVVKLIDRGTAPSRDGTIVLDQKSSLVDRGGDLWLEQAAQRLRSSGSTRPVVLEATSAVASASGKVLGYYSWGSNDPANQLRRFGLSFADGALAGMFVSTDGRTFVEPPAEWKPSGPNGGPVFAGSFQSLAGDLIRDGVTGVSAHVAEPYLDATIRPQILFPAYLAGFNLAESFYLAMPFLSWQTVIVGDPLCAPFREHAVAEEAISKGIDAGTELPALFSERQVTWLSRTGLNTEALKLTLKAEAQLAHGNRANYEPLLTRAVELEPRLTATRFRLALLYEADGKYDKAIDAYRKVVAAEPRNAVALNNLAYALAEHQHAPKEALPLAQKALGLLNDPVVADTLGWIHHLLGDDQSALPMIDRAVAGAPGNADVLIHAAFVHEALNDKAKALTELEAAIRIAPLMAGRDDVKALRARLKSPFRQQKSSHWRPYRLDRLLPLSLVRV